MRQVRRDAVFVPAFSKCLMAASWITGRFPSKSLTKAAVPAIQSSLLHIALPCLLLFLPSPVGQLLRAENWPSFRGPQGTGVSSEKALPATWSKSKNVAWRVPLPDRGNSTPAVWNGCVFVTQFIDKEDRRTLMCFNRADGKLRWQSGVTYKESEPTNTQNPYCSASPTTDGEHVVAMFGSAGLYCYDFAGKELWHRDLGKIDSWHGSGSSPVISGQRCFVNFGPGNDSALVACDVRTGKLVWKVALPKAETFGGLGFGWFGSRLGPPGKTDGRRERGSHTEANDESAAFEGAARSADLSGAGGFNGSWSTPVVVHVADHDELIVVKSMQVAAHEPATGKELWTCKGLPPQVFTSPAIANGTLIATGHVLPSGTHVMALKLGGRGDVTKTNRLWELELPKETIGSGVIAADSVFLVNDHGYLICLDLKTGKKRWEKRLKAGGHKSGSWSSILLVKDKLLITNLSGETFVVKASPDFQLLETNATSNETTCASLAVSDGQVFLRSYGSLWCFGTTPPTRDQPGNIRQGISAIGKRYFDSAGRLPVGNGFLP